VVQVQVKVKEQVGANDMWKEGFGNELECLEAKWEQQKEQKEQKADQKQ
jgi:hypothetical protein